MSCLEQSPPPAPRLSTSQLFQGKVSLAVDTCSRAVDLCQEDEDNTPDTDAMGQVGDRSSCVCLALETNNSRPSQDWPQPFV